MRDACSLLRLSMSQTSLLALFIGKAVSTELKHLHAPLGADCCTNRTGGLVYRMAEFCLVVHQSACSVDLSSLRLVSSARTDPLCYLPDPAPSNSKTRF